MSKTLTYKGTLAIGLEDKIKLSTMNGKTGYKITKFQIISTTPGAVDQEIICKIKSDKDANIGPTVEFTDDELLAVSYISEGASVAYPFASTIIIDKQKFNQDIFVSAASANSSTTPINYYIELETMTLTEIETTMLTLRNLRTISG